MGGICVLLYDDYDYCDVGYLEWLAEERTDWRDAGLLATQKAATRAKDYGLRLMIEKAREIRRGRKWRKRIDDRVYHLREVAKMVIK